MTESNKLVLIAIIGILIGLIFGRLLWYKNGLPTPDTNIYQDKPATDDTTYVPNIDTTENAQGQSALIGDAIQNTTASTVTNSVSVGSQPAGSKVVAAVVANDTVWVVVRDNVKGGTGKILGATHFGPGSATVTVPLQRATESGMSYSVSLQPYNSGTLDYSATLIMNDASGKKVMATFSAK